MRNALINNKDKIKYKVFEDRSGYKFKILGIGQKAIKYKGEDGEEKFAFYDSSEAFLIGTIVLTSFDNECWNEDIRERIKAQRKLCKETDFPMFAPQDGFCWSCGHQIFTEEHDYRARNRQMTGCPVCGRSYCD